MSSLKNARILYLDDAIDHLDLLRDFFQNKDIPLLTTQSVEEAEQLIVKKEVDIFLSDLRLTQIGYKHNGSYLLQKMRSVNVGVFLALLTAFRTDVRAEEDILRKKRIEIYQKTPAMDSLLSNLESDYKRHIQPFNFTSFGEEYLRDHAKRTLRELEEIQNKDLRMPVKGLKGDNRFSVRELIEYIQADDEIGCRFVAEWMNNSRLFDDIKAGKK